MAEVFVIISDENGYVLDKFKVTESEFVKTDNIKPLTKETLTNAVRDCLEFKFEISED